VKKKLPKTMYVVYLNDLSHICRVNRATADPSHWRPSAALIKGKWSKWLPPWIWGGIKVGSPVGTYFFKTEKQAVYFRDGAVEFKSYLANKLAGHNGGLK